jgi:hypothetical protein
MCVCALFPFFFSARHLVGQKLRVPGQLQFNFTRNAISLVMLLGTELGVRASSLEVPLGMGLLGIRASSLIVPFGVEHKG